ncbi:hypothetical protein KFK09_018811 [Dendrobium nobile]|uniref:Uncharacterized protein n=1 Tax=Dendrobium nobile TaxID=94219 RepID=A0A8T3AWU2_DENNO|nr:hypothetical protein KFK09_018811 [Dendrobium nobile]
MVLLVYFLDLVLAGRFFMLNHGSSNFDFCWPWVLPGNDVARARSFVVGSWQPLVGVFCSFGWLIVWVGYYVVLFTKLDGLSVASGVLEASPTIARIRG